MESSGYWGPSWQGYEGNSISSYPIMELWLGTGGYCLTLCTGRLTAQGREEIVHL